MSSLCLFRYFDAKLSKLYDIKDESYDAVVACEVIEHIYYPDVVFGKIYDALKPGGVVVGSIPHAFNFQTRIKFLFGTKKLSPLSDPTHINHFSAREFKEIMCQKFKEVEISGVTTSKYRWLQKIMPFFFAHTLLFKAKK